MVSKRRSYPSRLVGDVKIGWRCQDWLETLSLVRMHHPNHRVYKVEGSRYNRVSLRLIAFPRIMPKASSGNGKNSWRHTPLALPHQNEPGKRHVFAARLVNQPLRVVKEALAAFTPTPNTQDHAPPVSAAPTVSLVQDASPLSLQVAANLSKTRTLFTVHT